MPNRSTHISHPPPLTQLKRKAQTFTLPLLPSLQLAPLCKVVPRLGDIPPHTARQMGKHPDRQVYVVRRNRRVTIFVGAWADREDVGREVKSAEVYCCGDIIRRDEQSLVERVNSILKLPERFVVEAELRITSSMRWNRLRRCMAPPASRRPDFLHPEPPLPG
jgi:hypothetical protein